MTQRENVPLVGSTVFFTGIRTLKSAQIGVLTKPDRIPVGEESSWLPFLRNEKEPLKNNWFCVKQPSSNDLKQQWTWEQARSKEDDFFATTAPWNELEGIYAKYLRTGNLVERLSHVLSDLVAKRCVCTLL